MKYFILGLLLLVSVYPFSYVKYVWSKKNYLGALGMLILTLLSLAVPAILLLSR